MTRAAGKQTVLVTGASGLIGTALVAALKQKPVSIICQSRQPHPEEPGVRWIKHDLERDDWSAAQLPEIDVVYHLAGQTSTYVARKDPIADLSANVTGLLRLLERLSAQKAPAFVVMAGTATEIGMPAELPLHEAMADDPVTFYDLSKLTAERYLTQYSREGKVGGCSLRLANVFGRSQPGQQADRGIIDKVFKRALAGEEITVYGDGNFLRDYVFIDDVVSAFILAAEHREQTNGRHFFIGGGKGILLKDAFQKVADLAASASGKPARLRSVPPPAELSVIESRNAVMDSTAFRKATGWTPRFGFDAALRAAYERYIPA